MTKFENNLDKLETGASSMTRDAASTFIIDEELCKPPGPCLAVRRFGKMPSVLPASCLQQAKQLRTALELPSRSTRRGPFSESASNELLNTMTSRQIESVDVAMMAAAKANGGEVPSELLINTSPSLSRKAWTWNGMVNTLTTNTALIQASSLSRVGPSSLFQMQGWEADHLPKNAMSASSHREASKLAGNMMAVPCVSAVVCALLCVVPMSCGGDLLVDQ